MSVSPAGNRLLLGIAFMALAVTLFPFLNASVKYLTADYPTWQIVWARYAGHLLFMIILFAPSHGTTLFRTRSLGIQFGRSLLLLSSTALYFTALTYISMPTAASISFTSPFIVVALSVPLLGEKVGPRRWGAVAIGFLGALLIIRPGGEDTHWAVLLVVANASCYALYQVLTRRVAGVDSPETTITLTAVVGTAVACVIAPFDWRMPQEALHWALFAGVGLFGGLGHYFVVKAFQYAEASAVAPIGYGQLVGAVVLGYLVFGDFPDLMTWLGAAVIVGCGLYIAVRERKAA